MVVVVVVSIGSSDWEDRQTGRQAGRQVEHTLGCACACATFQAM
jgi:hypothetical protein